MKMLGMGHVGINAADFSKSIVFYRDILGLEELSTHKFDDFEMTMLKMPDGGWLELFDYGNRKHKAAKDDSAVGYRHFAFLVDDVEAWEKHLILNDVPIKMSSIVLEQLGTKAMLCTDPDGTEVELFELLK